VVCAADDGKKYCDPSTSVAYMQGKCASRCTRDEWEDYCAGSDRNLEECESYCAADDGKRYCDPSTSAGDVVCGHCCTDEDCWRRVRDRLLLPSVECLDGECCWDGQC
jgi:hypothetical protein